MKKLLVFAIVLAFLTLPSTIFAAEQTTWNYQGYKWSHPNTAWVLEQYDTKADKPGCIAWLPRADKKIG